MSGRAAEMRRAFDESFANPITLDEKARLPALVVMIAGRRWVVRLPDIAGVARVKPPLPVPGGSAGLLGLTGVRGALVPVYSLAALLGLTESPKGDTCWLALVSHGGTLGLAFDELERHIELAAEAVHAAADGSKSCEVPAANGDLLGSEHLPMVDIATVIATIEKGAGG
jgi:chemotaxis signal transduction protein